MSEQILSEGKQVAEKPFPWRCPRCRQKTVNRTTMPYSCKRTHKGRVVTVEVPNLAVPRCSNCGEIVFDYIADEQIRAALRTQFDAPKTAACEGKIHHSEDAGTLEEQVRRGGDERMGRVSRKFDGHYRTDEPLVSVWLGWFPDQSACERYFHKNGEGGGPDGLPTCLFWNDLGIRWFDGDFEESSGYIGAPVPVAELLGRGWSYGDSFREPLLAACRAKGVESANIIIFLFNFDYPAEADFSCPYLTFLGVFPYSPDAQSVIDANPPRDGRFSSKR